MKGKIEWKKVMTDHKFRIVQFSANIVNVLHSNDAIKFKINVLVISAMYGEH